MKAHPLITSLINFKGNARGCVYPEPLNGIPYNLLLPFSSLYMVALGVSDSQIGLIVSISWLFQLVFALVSGLITDKLGRRKTTLIFDLISWALPALISAAAQNFWFFLGAAMINSFMTIPQNSWMCLLVEDSASEELMDIFSWIYIAGLLSAFFAPLAGVLIKTYTFIPTMRVLYLFAAASFALKAVITYRMTTETRQGEIRMQETRQTNLFEGITEYSKVIRQVLHTPRTLYTTGIMVVMSICMMINNTFWSIIATQKIKIPVENIAIFPFAKSLIMLMFFFVVIPRLHARHFKTPMMLGFLGFALSQLILVTTPVNGYVFLLISVLLEACSLATLHPLIDQLMVLTIDPNERARIQSILAVSIILITSPFGWIAGILSGINKSLPFLLNIILFMLGVILAYLAGRASITKSELLSSSEVTINIQ